MYVTVYVGNFILIYRLLSGLGPVMHVSSIAKSRHVDSFAMSEFGMQQNRHGDWCCFVLTCKDTSSVKMISLVSP